MILTKLSKFGISIMVCASVFQIYAQDVLKVAMSGGYPPWNFTKGAEIVGFEPEMMREICKRMQRECKIVKADFRTLQQGVRFKKYDLGVSGLATNKNTDRVLITSAPYAKNLNVFASKEGSDFAKTFCLQGCPAEVDFTEINASDQKVVDNLISALKGKKLGIQKNTAIFDFVRHHGDWFEATVVMTYPFTSNAFEALEKGEVDVILVRDANFNVLLEKKPTEVVVSPVYFTGGRLGANVKASSASGNQALIDAFNAALQSMKADGKLSELSTTWFGKDISPK